MGQAIAGLAEQRQILSSFFLGQGSVLRFLQTDRQTVRQTDIAGAETVVCRYGTKLVGLYTVSAVRWSDREMVWLYDLLSRQPQS